MYFFFLCCHFGEHNSTKQWTDFANDVAFVTSALTTCFTAALRRSRSSESTFWNSFFPGSFATAIDANSGLLFFIYMHHEFYLLCFIAILLT